MTSILEPPQKSAEAFEWAWDEKQKKWVKITRKNSMGRRCGGCNCPCPCTCACCRNGCCSNRQVADK